MNQSTAGRTARLPMRILSHTRSCSQKRPIFDTNSTPPTASDTISRRVNRKTSAEVVTVPSTRHVTAFTIDLVCVSVNIDASDHHGRKITP